MSKTLRALSVILILSSIVLCVVILVASHFSPLTPIWAIIGIMMMGILLLIYIWKEKDILRKIAYICMIILGVLLMISAPNIGISNVAFAATGILLFISTNKCNVPFIIAISLCSILSFFFTNDLDLSVPALLIMIAGILLNIVSTKNLNKHIDSTEALKELKKQFDMQLISEEEYIQKKSEILCKLR